MNATAPVRLTPRLSASMACALFGLSALAARAQQQPPAEDLSNLDLKTLMNLEVIVTAQRLPENAQNVPIAVSVASGEWIDSIGAKTPTDLIHYVPGFTGDTVGTGTPTWAIRGIS